MHDICEALTQYNPQIVAITETWVPETKHEVSLLGFNKYQCFHNPRPNRRGGGIMMMFHPNIKASPMKFNANCPSSCQLLVVQQSYPSHTWILVY